jgi:hypothetical protein
LELRDDIWVRYSGEVKDNNFVDGPEVLKNVNILTCLASLLVRWECLMQTSEKAFGYKTFIELSSSFVLGFKGY